jgi:hypothetical protein
MTTPAKTPWPVGDKDYDFTVSRAEGAAYETDGLREEFAYRDLGVSDATHGEVHAHIIKAKHLNGGHNGLHRHVVDFQFAMVLEGWVSFFYADHGEITYQKGDTVTVPAIRCTSCGSIPKIWCCLRSPFRRSMTP